MGWGGRVVGNEDTATGLVYLEWRSSRGSVPQSHVAAQSFEGFFQQPYATLTFRRVAACYPCQVIPDHHLLRGFFVYCYLSPSLEDVFVDVQRNVLVILKVAELALHIDAYT